MESGSTLCSRLDASHFAKADFASRLVARKASRNAASSANDFSLASWLRSVIQPSPTASVIVLASAGLAKSSQRRGATPLVLLLKRSGNISAKSFTVLERNRAE